MRPIFIGGAGRSGTTLLRVMLNAHPHMCSGPEFKFVPEIVALYNQVRSVPDITRAFALTDREVAENFSRFIGGFFEKFVEQSSGARLVEKTPHNVLVMKELGVIFPHAQFIHIIRDGRDVASSLVRMNWQGWDGQPLWYVKNIASAATYWAQVVQQAMRDARTSGLNGRVLELRYEELVRDPEQSMRRVLAFLNEPWDESVLRYHEIERPDEPLESSSDQVRHQVYTSALGKWQSVFSPEDRQQFKQIAGPLLVNLGYARSHDW